MSVGDDGTGAGRAACQKAPGGRACQAEGPSCLQGPAWAAGP